jgi:hypothetical protein
MKTPGGHEAGTNVQWISLLQHTQCMDIPAGTDVTATWHLHDRSLGMSMQGAMCDSLS